MSKPKFKISCEASGGKAVIRIDGYISSWSNNAAGFKAQLDSVIALGITTADVYINSGGGSCFEANEIANELGRFKGTKNAIIGALCASAATYIACICDTATGAKNMSYMIHKPLLSVDGNADEIESQLKLLKNMQKSYAQAYADKTGMSTAEIETMWKEDYWMNAEEAKELGFIDEIDGDTEITPEDILAIEASGYKNAPKITATTQPKTDYMKDLIIAAMGIDPKSTDAQILAHYEGIKAKAATADALKVKLDAVTAEALTVKIKAVTDTAKANKQITDVQVAYYEKQLRASFDDTKAHIESLPKAVKLTDAIIPEGGAGTPAAVDRKDWKYKDYQDKDPEALAQLAKTDEAKFKALFKAHYGHELSDEKNA